MRTKYELVMTEKPLNEGLTRAEILDLMDMLEGTEAIPFEMRNDYTAALGFISASAAEKVRRLMWGLDDHILLLLDSMVPYDYDGICEYQHSDGTKLEFWFSRENGIIQIKPEHTS